MDAAEAAMRELAAVFKALGDETRLRMLTLLLRHGELCVCDLERVLGITQSRASRHLRYLRSAGLVDDRRAAMWVHYRIADRPGPEPRSVIRALRRLLAGREADLDGKLAAWLRRKAARRSGCAARAVEAKR